jgi:Ca2+-binding EF-hand superfamily protein
MTEKKTLLVVSFIATIVVAVATFAQKAPVPKQQAKQSLAQQNVRELLLLMDTDKNGKISKQEWMKFMEAEFDTLDKDKKGELDQNELLQSTVTVKRIRSSDLGK